MSQINQLKTAFQSLNVSKKKLSVIIKVLSNVEESILKSWIDNLKIEDGRIAGTFYEELGSRLSYNDFVALYEALGYNFDTQSVWRDWWCTGEGCQAKKGFSCGAETCYPR